jgi:hypothetical protein
MKFFMIAIGAVLALLGISLMKINSYVGLIIAAGGVVLAAINFVQLLKQFKTPAPTSPVTGAPNSRFGNLSSAEKPSVIHHPKLGFLNLVGEAATTSYLQDLDNLEDIFFQNVDLGAQSVPQCNILFLYCNLEPSGRIAGQKFSLRELAKSSGAQIVVVASENRPEVLTSPLFGQYLKLSNDSPVNFIFTVSRNGENFGKFFQDLFNQMLAGVSMPVAWAKLAPQNPDDQKERPAIISLLEAGHISLRPI